MRKLVSSVLGAIALGSAAPALGAESIAHELAFTSETVVFDLGTPTEEPGAAAYDAYFLPPADEALPGAQTIALAVPAVDEIAYRGFFDAVSSVPEPSAWMVMIIGLGSIGYIMRSRKRPLPQAV